MIQHLVSVEQLGLNCRIILFCIQIVFYPFAICLLSYSIFSAFTWLYRLFPFTLFPIDLALFFSFTLISPQFALSISVLRLCTALGIKTDSLWDWMRVAMASCIWKAIHSTGTLRFNLKQDWCWQTSHPLYSKMFPPLPSSIGDGQRACASL